VALKVEGGDATRLARLLRTGEILQQFRHPNIVRYSATGRCQGDTYLAMEYVTGPSLADVLAKRGALPWPEVVGLAVQICDALACIHRCGVVHRNLKPSNLLLTEQAQVKLIGFGRAKILDETTLLSSTGHVIGTPPYMAPEQILGTPAISHKTDLYGLGTVLYHLLTGETIFRGETAISLMQQHLSETPPKPSSRVLALPASLDGLIGRLTAKAPCDRPADAQDVSDSLSRVGREKQDRVKNPGRGPLPPGLWQWLFHGKPDGTDADGPVQASPSGVLWDRDLDGP
jgi:serine/threonine-protein kinase